MKISHKLTLGVVSIASAVLSLTLVGLYCSKVIPNNKPNLIPVLFGIVLLSVVAITCLFIICCCKNSLFNVDRNGYVSIDGDDVSDDASIRSHESQDVCVNDQIKADFENVIRRFSDLLSNTERCDVRNAGDFRFRIGNVKTAFFFPIFKTNFDVILNNLLSKGLLSDHDANNQRIINELNPQDYAFVCIAAKLIVNTSLCEVYPLWVRNYIKVLAGLPIDHIDVGQRRYISNRIISLLCQRVYFADSYKDFGEKFAELMNSIDVYEIETVQDLYKIWSKPQLVQCVDQLSKLRYFRYYNFFGADCGQAKADLAFQVLNSYLINDGVPLEVASEYAATMQKLEDAKFVRARAKQNTQEMKVAERNIALARVKLKKLDAEKLVAGVVVCHINKTTISWFGSSLDTNLVDVQFTKRCFHNFIKYVSSTDKSSDSVVRTSKLPAPDMYKTSANSRIITRPVVGYSSTMDVDYGSQASSSRTTSTTSDVAGIPKIGTSSRKESRPIIEALDVMPEAQVGSGGYIALTDRPKTSTINRKKSGLIARTSGAIPKAQAGSSRTTSTTSDVAGIPKMGTGSRKESRPVTEASSTMDVDSMSQRSTDSGERVASSVVNTTNPLYRRMGRKQDIPSDINLPSKVSIIIPSKEDLRDLLKRKFEYRGFVCAMSAEASRIQDMYKQSKEYSYITYPDFIRVLADVFEYKDIVKNRLESLLMDVVSDDVWETLDNDRKQKIVFCAKVIYSCPLLSIYFNNVKGEIAKLSTKDIDLSSLSNDFVNQVCDSLGKIEIYRTVVDYVDETKSLLKEYLEFLKNGDIRGVNLKEDSIIMQGMECSQELFSQYSTICKIRSKLMGFCEHPVLDSVAVQMHLRENLEISI